MLSLSLLEVSVIIIYFPMQKCKKNMNNAKCKKNINNK